MDTDLAPRLGRRRLSRDQRKAPARRVAHMDLRMSRGIQRDARQEDQDLSADRRGETSPSSLIRHDERIHALKDRQSRPAEAHRMRHMAKPHLKLEPEGNTSAKDGLRGEPNAPNAASLLELQAVATVNTAPSVSRSSTP